jgi:hypothetical protein
MSAQAGPSKTAQRVHPYHESCTPPLCRPAFPQVARDRQSSRNVRCPEPAAVCAAAAGVDRGSGGAAHPGAAGGLADDAGHGDRRADRLAALVDGAQGPRPGAAAGVSAARSGVADDLSGRRGGPVRLVVSRHHPAGGVRPDPHRHAAAGAGDGDRLCPLAGRSAHPLAGGRGSVRRLVATHRRARGGAAGAGLGRGRRGRPTAPAPDGPDRAGPCLSWRAGRQDHHLRPGRPGGQGAGRAGQRLSGDLVPARPHLQLASGLQRPAGRLARCGQPAPPAGVGLRPGRPDPGRPGRDAALAAGGATDRVAQRAAAATRPLHPPGQQRLLGPPGGGRPSCRGGRRPRSGAGLVRRAAGRRPWALLGPPSDAQRPRPPAGRRPAAPRPRHAGRHQRPPRPGRGPAAQPGRLRRRLGLDGEVA